jgi:hypothetical protein
VIFFVKKYDKKGMVGKPTIPCDLYKSEVFLYTVQTVSADTFSVEERNIINVAAEDACGGVFL